MGRTFGRKPHVRRNDGTTPCSVRCASLRCTPCPGVAKACPGPPRCPVRSRSLLFTDATRGEKAPPGDCCSEGAAQPVSEEDATQAVFEEEATRPSLDGFPGLGSRQPRSRLHTRTNRCSPHPAASVSSLISNAAGTACECF